MNENQEEERQPPSTSSRPPQPSRPTITLPPRTSFETMFNNSGTGGNTGFSPGPMTLVSSFFSDGEDCKSFSQLLAGAMMSPADRAGFPQLEERSSGDDSGFRFKNGPPSPMFPAGFLDSPGGLFSPGQVGVSIRSSICVLLYLESLTLSDKVSVFFFLAFFCCVCFGSTYSCFGFAAYI